MIRSLKDTCQSVTIKFKAKYQLTLPLNFVIVTAQMDSGDALFLSSSSEQPTHKLDLGVGTCLDKKIVDDRSFMLIQSRIDVSQKYVIVVTYIFSTLPLLSCQLASQFMMSVRKTSLKSKLSISPFIFALYIQLTARCPNYHCHCVPRPTSQIVHIAI
jgi:hypothetical protein